MEDEQKRLGSWKRGLVEVLKGVGVFGLGVLEGAMPLVYTAGKAYLGLSANFDLPEYDLIRAQLPPLIGSTIGIYSLAGIVLEADRLCIDKPHRLGIGFLPAELVLFKEIYDHFKKARKER